MIKAHIQLDLAVWSIPTILITFVMFCCPVTHLSLTLRDLMHCSTPGFLTFTITLSLLKLMPTELVMPSNHLILYCLLLLPATFPSITVFSSELILLIRWPKHWNFSISPSSEYSGLISISIDWLDLLPSKELSRVFSNTTIQKHQFFGTQPPLLSNSHSPTWLLEKP